MQQLYRRIPKNLRRVRHFCSYWYWEMSKQGYYVRKQVQSDTILYGCIVSEKVWDISIQFSRWVRSNSWWDHELQHDRLPCPSPTPRVYSNSCQWCHPMDGYLILCCPFPPPSIPPSIRVFSNESVSHIRWPKYWSFIFSISPSKEYSGLISLRIDWLDLLAVQGTFESLLQHHSSKASVLWCSTFFIVQLSHPYRTTGKTITLTRWTLVSKVMSLLLNCGVGEDFWESLGLQGDPTSPSWKRNKYWIFIGKTDIEAEAPIILPPDAKNWLTGKTIALTRRTLVGKCCLCFWIGCLGLSQLSFQGAGFFEWHGCSHHPWWFRNPR